MNLSWLDDFLALAASGNFSRAAEERHMTQPAFGRRIRALEEWLGVTLFDRSSHPVRLTETGEWFRAVAREILARVAQVPEEARAVADAASSTLRLASTHALSFTFLPTWLRSLESHITVGPVQLVSDVMQHCESLLLNGRVQFVVCHWHEQVMGRLASVLKSMVLDGRGVAWLPLTLVSEELASGRLVQAGGDTSIIDVDIRLVRSHAAMPSAAEALWNAAISSGFPGARLIEARTGPLARRPAR